LEFEQHWVGSLNLRLPRMQRKAPRMPVKDLCYDNRGELSGQEYGPRVIEMPLPKPGICERDYVYYGTMMVETSA
jgi:hypothetical protein